MEITTEMLFYRLSKKHALQTEHIGTPGLTVREIHIWAKDRTPAADTLYLLKSANDLSISVRTAGDQGCFLVCTPCKTSTPKFLPQDTYAVLAEEITTEQLQAELFGLYNGLMRWDARFSEAILRKEDAKKIMSWGREMLEWGYAIIDADLKNLYSTPNYPAPWEEKTDYMPREYSHSLMMNPNFHAAAELKESFYYYVEVNDLDALCCNLFLSGAYYGRLVMYAGPKGSRIPAGAREIFERFAAHLEELFRHSTDFIGRRAKDQLHDLIHMLATGEKPALFIQSGVLENVGWKTDDLYTVIQFHFYEASGWNTHLATTLPYLARELEMEWYDSCAVIDKAAILWVIHTKSSDKAEDPHSFHQRLASFVREHVCHAGISPQFQDFSLIPYAVQAANAAFRLGQALHPHFWYYLFDDYQLEYMLEEIGKNLPASMLCHPAIPALIIYDKKHHTELAHTLKVYLQCNLNMTAAAKQLYIHRTTFCRRMEHIQQITKLDIHDPDTILALLLSYKLMEH